MHRTSCSTPVLRQEGHGIQFNFQVLVTAVSPTKLREITTAQRAHQGGDDPVGGLQRRPPAGGRGARGAGCGEAAARRGTRLTEYDTATRKVTLLATSAPAVAALGVALASTTDNTAQQPQPYTMDAENYARPSDLTTTIVEVQLRPTVYGFLHFSPARRARESGQASTTTAQQTATLGRLMP